MQVKNKKKLLGKLYASKFWALFDAKGSVEDGKTAGRCLKKSEMIVKFFINFLPWLEAMVAQFTEWKCLVLMKMAIRFLNYGIKIEYSRLIN